MPARYAPLPTSQNDPDAADEMEAAFDDEDDEDDARGERQPLNPSSRNGYHPLAHNEPELGRPSSPAHAPTGTYDFEAGDFDYTRPPPGSPPGPSDRALPNEYGNSNGLVPSLVSVDAETARRRDGWFKRTAASILPSQVSERLGLEPHVPTRAIGGGESNDGVFANVTAKPSRSIRIQEGDETYLVPEDTQKDVPPSYAAAQADSVPPYWETTIHAPSSSNNPGDIIIDSLPTGSMFSFLWNMLVSISFQFVGFLLTYLLHTTHAAKLGSRAGLGITLIQYGFAMRGKEESEGAQGGWTVWRPPQGGSVFDPPYDNSTINSTPTIPASDESSPIVVGDGTSEWLSFLLMTIGWFVLLTSLLGFYRVKRWERGILASHRDAPPNPGDQPRHATVLHSLERVFGVQGLADGSLLRTGLGIPSSSRAQEGTELMEVVVEPGSPTHLTSTGEQYVLPIDPTDPQRNDQVTQAYIMQARLQHDLRSAGLL